MIGIVRVNAQTNSKFRVYVWGSSSFAHCQLIRLSNWMDQILTKNSKFAYRLIEQSQHSLIDWLKFHEVHAISTLFVEFRRSLPVLGSVRFVDFENNLGSGSVRFGSEGKLTDINRSIKI